MLQSSPLQNDGKIFQVYHFILDSFSLLGFVLFSYETCQERICLQAYRDGAQASLSIS